MLRPRVKCAATDIVEVDSTSSVRKINDGLRVTEFSLEAFYSLVNNRKGSRVGSTIYNSTIRHESESTQHGGRDTLDRY